MAKVIIINAGSSSLKFQLFDDNKDLVLAQGLVERIGIEGGFISIKANGEKIVIEQNFKNHKVAIDLLLELLKKHNIIKDLEEITKAGHRVVQGGEVFTKATLVEEKELQQIKDFSSLAPLHNPHNALGIEVFKELLPNIKNIAVFDTEFHNTLPAESYLYPVPYSWYEKNKVRKYGAHGISHKYVSSKAAELRNKDIKDEKYIICHLGNGASLTAVQAGESIQTSMGFTPLDGIMMGTRSGSIDPAIIQYMCKELNKTVDEVSTMLNFESGLKGVSGISSDFRDIKAGLDKGDESAMIAFNLYVTKVVEFIGAYYFRLGGVDAIVFTAGIGENAYYLREAICKKLEFLGLELDVEANNNNEINITKPNSKISVMVIPTNEEYQIFMETKKF